MYAKLEEKKRIRSKITETLCNTGYEDKAEQILQLIDEKQPVPGKKLYVNALHRFGRTAGCEIYRILKAV